MLAHPDTTIVLADDHKIIRDGLSVLFEREPGYKVIEGVPDGRSLVEAVLRLQPAIVISDMEMPDLNGIDAAMQLRAAGYKGKIILLSMHAERHVVANAIAAGVNAYVHKDHAFTQLMTAIEQVVPGRVWLSPELGVGISAQGPMPLLTDILTRREREVLQLFAEGKSAKEVAHALSVSPKTVETHRAHLFSKLKAGNLVELARIAVKEGLAHL